MGKKRQNNVFGQKRFFAKKNFRTEEASGLIQAPLCSSRQGSSKHVPSDLQRSGQNLTSSQGHVRSHVDPSWSCCISGDSAYKTNTMRQQPGV